MDFEVLWMAGYLSPGRRTGLGCARGWEGSEVIRIVVGAGRAVIWVVAGVLFDVLDCWICSVDSVAFCDRELWVAC